MCIEDIVCYIIVVFLRHSVHWLKVPERIQFRLCVLVYRCLQDTAPSYLAETLQLVSDVRTRRHLRSAASLTLTVPTTRRTTLGDRTFPVAAARAWNALPLSVKQANTLLTFRRRLKSVVCDVSVAD